MKRMEHITWTAEHSVEIPDIDSQHEELLGFFNEAVDNCSGEKTEERAYFDAVIEPFIKLLSKHFETEEQFLSGGDYVYYDKHKLDHIKLLEKINFVKQEIQNNRWKMNLLVLATTLKDWFMYHFDSFDLSAKEYFREGNSRVHKEKCLAF